MPPAATLISFRFTASAHNDHFSVGLVRSLSLALCAISIVRIDLDQPELMGLERCRVL